MKNDNYDMLKLSNQLCFPLYVCSKEIVRRYKPFLDPLDLTYTQYITMMVMWEEKTITVKELGKKLFLDSGTMTPLLKKLEVKGYIVRKRSEKDERIVFVTITELGEKLKEAAATVPEKLGKCVNISSEEAGQLYSLLYKILNEITDEKES